MVAGTFGFAIPALAASPTPQVAYCANGVTCLYANGNYVDLMWSGYPGAYIEDMRTIGYNDALSSWSNNSGTNARFRYDAFDRGTCRNMPSQRTATASATNPDNDRASSAYLTGSCP